MEWQERRSEPRFEHGARIRIQILRDSQWMESPAFTVNISESGLLITMQPAPEVGERIRVEPPAQPGAWVEATVRRVVRGTANYLVGLRLHEKQKLPFSLPAGG